MNKCYNRVFVLLVTGLLVLCLSACASSTAGMRINSNDSGIETNALGNDLQVRQIKGRTINGLYQGKVVIANAKTSTQNLQYQFRWFDAQNNEIGANDNPWTPFQIYGQDEYTLEALAPEPAVTGFKISIRSLKANKVFKTNFFGIE